MTLRIKPLEGRAEFEVSGVRLTVERKATPARRRATGAEMVKDAVRGRPPSPYREAVQEEWLVAAGRRVVAVVRKLPGGWSAGHVSAPTFEGVLKLLAARLK